MRAARIHAFGQDPVVEEVPVPIRKAGRTTVAVEAAAIGHLDLTVTSGNFDIQPDLPHTGGSEGVGTVVESDTFETGTRVLVRGAGVGLVKSGCWADYVVASDKAVTAVTADLDPQLAAAYFLPCTTGYVAVHDVGGLVADERVIVSGASGAVGSMAAQFAMLAGASEVIATVPRKDQTTLLPHGTSPVVGHGGDVLDALGGEPIADLLVDTLGGQDLAKLAKLVRPGGRAVLVGYTLGTSLTLDLPTWLLQEVRLLPVNMIRHDARARALAPKLAAKLAADQLSLAVQPFPLADIAVALHRLRDGRVRGRAVVVPEES
jgi:NADPH:quinone reductase-like Zn-dependent oxidoreductase